jgi:branched-chain amino acid transport system permease protein
MEQLIQGIINGVMLGGFYAAMALGFSVIWGVMGVINLAHGEFLMVGAYLTWVLNKTFGLDAFAALIVVIPIMFVIGVIVQLVLINRVVERPHLVSLLVTFGLGIAIANAAKLIFGADPRITDTALSGFWRIANTAITIPVTKFFITLVALTMMGSLYLFLHRTRLGKSIRAAAQNKEAARMVGIEIKLVYVLTFAICIALTGAAGMLASTTQAVFPFMGPPFTLRAFAITAMAGLGNVPGVLMGGIVLGLVEVLVGIYVPGIGTNLGIVASYVLLVIILVTRPQGLFGGLKPATEVR